MNLWKKAAMDMLEQKEAKLSSLNQKSDDAIQLVRATINEFDVIEMEIDQTVSEINEIQTRASAVRTGLEARREKNQQIKQNFKRLLCEE